MKPSMLGKKSKIPFSLSLTPHREVGAIIRSLECYPTEAEIQDMLQEVEEDEPTGQQQL